MATYKITLSQSNWSGGTAAIWYDTVTRGFYEDSALTTPATSVAVPTRSQYRFTGFYSASSGGTQYIDAGGNFTDALLSLSITGARTFYAQGKQAYKITISANSGTGGTTAFYFDSVLGKFYDGTDLESEIMAIIPHTLECFAFLGCYSSNNTTSTLRVSPDGTIATDWTPTAAATIYAQWERVSWKITLNKQSGAGGTDAIYGGVGGGFWLDDLCTERAETVVPPTRTGYDFAGYWQNTGGGGGRYITADGTVALSQSTVTTGAFTIYAAWVARDFTLTFDYNGGTGETASKTVTFASAVGTLPSATHPKGDFVGWRVNGSLITSSTVWNIDSDATAVAEWDYYFGRVVDYFGLGSETLVPFESDEGTNRPRVVTRHYGKAAGAEQTGPVWRNPSVKYMVVGDMTLSVTLGKAFAKKTGTINGPYVSNGTWYFGNHSGMTETGYMITEVSIATRRGKFPVVTVSSVANEGADAINKFAVSVPISARARAQNLLGGVSGGGELQAATLRAVCDPVVLTEGPAPCASDAVNGRYELHAETLAANGEAAPTASGGFTATGEPATNAGTEYTRYRLTASKEIT